MHGKALSAVRDTLRSSESGLAPPASSHHFCTPTTIDIIHEISPAQPRLLSAARVCPGPHLEVSTFFSDAPADHSPGGFVVAPSVDPSLALPAHGPCLVEGTITSNDASFTTTIAINSAASVLAPFGCVAPHEPGSPKTFIRRYILDRMLVVGAASCACEQNCTPRCWEGVGESTPQTTSTSVRLSVYLFRGNDPRCSLAVRACVVPPSVMQHAVILGS